MSQDDDDLADFGARLRAQLAPVATTPDRAASMRERAHAELLRANERLHARAARARRRTVFVLETSTALAAGASYVVWIALQLYGR